MRYEVYKEQRKADAPVVPFGIIGFYRYFWYIIRLLAYATYRPVPLPENPTYSADEDVTIIVPTIDAGEEFRGAFWSCEPGMRTFR